MSAVGEHQVTSEIYSDIPVGSPEPGSEGYVTTKFYFRRPTTDPVAEVGKTEAALEYDSDGDPILERQQSEDVIQIKHSSSTSLRMVGLQVWRGALLLADWALHYGPSLLRGATVLELGTGTGLTSIVAAMHAREVVSTDVDLGGILDLIKTNIDLNKRLVKARSTVLGLDFFSKEWSKEILNKLKEVSIVLAADVIYDVDLTEAFVQTVVKIMNVKPKKTLYFALEKRFVFTTDDLDSVAPVYEHFVSYLDHIRPNSWTVEQIGLDFPQYFHYERVKQLVLWKIAS